MKRIPLSDYVSEHGQTKTAADLGMYQSAISKALKSKRKITVLVHEDGTVKAEENRPFPSNQNGCIGENINGPHPEKKPQHRGVHCG